MNTSKDYIDELIIGSLTGNLDKKSLEELRIWISCSSENEKYFLQAKELWFSSLVEKKTEFDKDRAFRQFKDRIEDINKKKNLKKRYYNVFTYLRYASVVAILLIVSYFSYWRGESSVKECFSDVVVEAPLGSTTKLGLPDGSQVWLNAGSKMTYSQGFGFENRKVTLAGEAYFEVKRNEELPFFVETHTLRVRVLGTKFNFRDYSEDQEAIVSLNEGRVSLTNLLRKENDMVLSPNERVVLDKKSGKMHIEHSKASNAMQWTSGYLFFDEELLTDIAKDLERSYNIQIHIANDTLKQYRFYGYFICREQSIYDILDALSATRKIHYSIEGKNVTLY